MKCTAVLKYERYCKVMLTSCYGFNSSKAEDTASDSVEAAKNASDKKGKRCIVLSNIARVE